MEVGLPGGVRGCRGPAQPSGGGTSVVLFMVLAILLSWAPRLLLPGREGAGGPGASGSDLLLTGAPGPLLAAVIVRLARRDGRGWGLGWRAPARWVGGALVLPAGWMAAVIAVGTETGLSQWPGPAASLPSVLVRSVRNLLLLGLPLGLFQELAWRGFLLPRLAAHGKMAASLAVGGVWWACACPLVIGTGFYGNTSPSLALPALLLHLLPLSLLMTWAWSGSGRSLVVCVILHALFWTFAGDVMQPAHLTGMPILVGPRGILSSMFLVLGVWWLYLRGAFRSRPHADWPETIHELPEEQG